MRSRWWQGDWPVTQPYGCTDYSGEGPSPNHPECPYFHDGLDLGLLAGTLLYAGMDVTVRQVGWYYDDQPDTWGGPYALLLDAGDYTVWLLHLSAAFVAPGSFVPAGMLIGASGSRGFSTGPHLHFEVTGRGAGYRDSFDPAPWLDAGSSPGDPLPDAWRSSPAYGQRPLSSEEDEMKAIIVTGSNGEQWALLPSGHRFGIASQADLVVLVQSGQYLQTGATVSDGQLAQWPEVKSA